MGGFPPLIPGEREWYEGKSEEVNHMTETTQERKARWSKENEEVHVKMVDDLMRMLYTEGLKIHEFNKLTSRAGKVSIGEKLDDLIAGSWDYTINDDVPDCDNCDDRRGEPSYNEGML